MRHKDKASSRCSMFNLFALLFIRVLSNYEARNQSHAFIYVHHRRARDA